MNSIDPVGRTEHLLMHKLFVNSEYFFGQWPLLYVQSPVQVHTGVYVWCMYTVHHSSHCYALGVVRRYMYVVLQSVC
ncbi:hypothetical protein NP493_1857g00010 [Ridgeia piscesae]|uniref:Uncharacterized protein n=1 Tax=Ridgeia piscesae TaxID=27915 RepID=A0AAD9JR89_RIDPI|nr:hypothetical protein NP493_1857g00010 [Ridgeia piscesae]